MKRKRLLGIAAILLVWGLLLWGPVRREWTAAGPDGPAGPREATSTDAPALSSVSALPRVTPSRAPSRPSIPDRLPELQPAELIDELEIDKTRVCPGEDFLVKVRGKLENASGALPIAELNFNIDGEFGDAIVASSPRPGSREYTVVASNGVDKIEHRRFEVEVLSPDSAECARRSFAVLTVTRSRFDPNGIEAHVTATHGIGEAVRYQWDFGDGTRLQTTEPLATHSYALRDQARTISSYVVQVQVIDARNRPAEGRDSIHLDNAYYRARSFGDRPLPVVYDPFPKRVSEGRAEVALTFRNVEEEPVVFTHARLIEKSCYAGQPDREREVDPRSLGLPAYLEAKEIHEAKLMLTSELVADDACVLQVELSGDSVPARIGEPMPRLMVPYRAVTASLTVELQAAPLAEEGGASGLAAKVVEDPALLAKLLRATEIVGGSGHTGDARAARTSRPARTRGGVVRGAYEARRCRSAHACRPSRCRASSRPAADSA